MLLLYIELGNIAATTVVIDASEATGHLQGSTTHSQVQQDTQTMDSKSYV